MDGDGLVLVWMWGCVGVCVWSVVVWIVSVEDGWLGR